MSAAAGNGRSHFERLTPVQQAEVRRLLGQKKMYDADNERMHLFIGQLTAQKEILDAQIATNQAKITSNEAQLAGIKERVREIMASVGGGHRRTRAHRKAKRGTRKHR